MLRTYTNKNIKNIYLLKQKKQKQLLLSLISLIVLNLSFFCKEISLIKNDISIVLSNKCTGGLLFLLLFLRDHFKFQFKELVDICAVDYFYKTKDSRYVLNYSLLSFKYKVRLRLKVYTNAVTGLFSSTGVYSSAGWLEREVWDTFGIFFKNHFDLRRILTDYGFEGFPFRKDFPLSGYVELRYDAEKRIVIYDLLELSQEFRYFEFINPWSWRT